MRATSGRAPGEASDRHVDRRALNRSLLARQRLLERSNEQPLAVVDTLVGMQAQLPTDPYVGLWSRVAEFHHDDLAQPLLAREVARVTLMRGTIHLVSAADARRFWPLMQPVVARSTIGNLARSYRGRDITEFLAEGARHLTEQHATRGELRDWAARRWPDEDSAALSYLIAYLTPTVQVTPRGVWGESMRPTYASFTAWFGRDADATAPLDDLVLRYLAAYGPAHPNDFQAWCGLTRTRAVFERLRPDLVTVRDESGRELFDVHGAPWPDPREPAPVRFLPVYDNVVLGLADRSRIFSDSRTTRTSMFAGPDANYGSLLVDGFIAGMYKVSDEGLTIQPIRPLTVADTHAIEDEGARLLHFLGAPAVDIRFI